MTVEAKVAAIISEYEVAFSAGEESGVAKGDIATVFRFIEVTDPDSRELLGVVSRPLVRFEIIEVQARTCVGQTFESVSPEAGNFTTALLLGGQRRRVTAKPVDVDRVTTYVDTGAPVTIERPSQENAHD